MKLGPVDEHMVVCWIVGALAAGLFGVFAILLIHLPPGPVAIFSLLALLALGLWAARRERRPWPNVHRHKEPLLVPSESTAEPDGQDGWLETQLALVGEWSHRMNQRIESAVAGTDVPGSSPAQESPRPPQGRAHRARSQFVLGCVGLALFAAGVSVTVAAAQEEWVPPPELSIAMGHGQVQRPVANVDLGTAAPISAHLEVVTRGRALWSAPLSSNNGTQDVVLPSDVLQPPSRVLLVAGGRIIRSVGG
jgi:type IV secretory pathway protease TraF